MTSELNGINMITLNFEVDYRKRLSVLSFLATTFQLIWKFRQMRKPILVPQMKALITAEVSIMMKTKHRKSAEMIELAITNFVA